MLDESLLGSIRNSFAAAVQRVNLPSLGGTFTFREASVREHKSLSKAVISNTDRQSVVYAATLAMLKNLCLEPEFDPRRMSEFDRLRAIVSVFAGNFFSKNLSIRCPVKSCGGSVKYSVGHGSLLEMMDSVDCSDVVFENSSDAGSVRVYANFPSAGRYLSLLESVDAAMDERPSPSQYRSMDGAFDGLSNSGDEFADMIRRRRELLKGKVRSAVESKSDVLGNVDAMRTKPDSGMMDLADIYIKRLQITSIRGSDNEFDIDMSDFGYEDTEKVLSALPMGLFMKEDGGNVVGHVAKELFARMNACVPRICCPQCGYEISKRLTLQSFFVFG